MSHDFSILRLKYLIVKELQKLEQLGESNVVKLRCRKTVYGQTFFVTLESHTFQRVLFRKCYSGFEINFYDIQIFGLTTLLDSLTPYYSEQVEELRLRTPLKILALLPFENGCQMVRLTSKIQQKPTIFFLRDITKVMQNE